MSVNKIAEPFLAHLEVSRKMISRFLILAHRIVNSAGAVSSATTTGPVANTKFSEGHK